MKQPVLTIVGLTVVMLVNCENAVAKNQTKQSAGIHRMTLPIAEAQPSPITDLDVPNAKAPPSVEVKAPVPAPNVRLALLNGLGFAGKIEKATIDVN